MTGFFELRQSDLLAGAGMVALLATFGYIWFTNDPEQTTAGAREVPVQELDDVLATTRGATDGQETEEERILRHRNGIVFDPEDLPPGFPDNMSPEDLERLRNAMNRIGDLEEGEWDVSDEDGDGDFEEQNVGGPAQQQQQQHQPPRSAANKNRVVGKKKAKSLAKKEQRRAYFEYVRQQAEEQRMEAENDDRQYGDIRDWERAERLAREQAAREEIKRRREEERRKEELEKESAEQTRRAISSLQPGERLRLDGDAQFKVAKIAESAARNIVIVGSYVVRVSDEQLERVAKAIDEKGSLSFDELAKLFEAVLLP